VTSHGSPEDEASRAGTATAEPGGAGVGLTTLSLGTGIAALAYLVTLVGGEAPGWGAGAIAVSIGLLLFGLLDLGGSPRGADRKGSGATLRWVFAGTALWVGAGLALLVVMPAADTTDPQLILGLPPRAAWMIFGVGLAPGLFVPLAYALFFDQVTLSESSLERLRETARRVAEEKRAKGEYFQGRDLS